MTSFNFNTEKKSKHKEERSENNFFKRHTVIALLIIKKFGLSYKNRAVQVSGRKKGWNQRRARRSIGFKKQRSNPSTMYIVLDGKN